MSASFHCPHCSAAIPAINPDPFGRCPSCKKMLQPAFAAPAAGSAAAKKPTKPSLPKKRSIVDEESPSAWRKLSWRLFVIGIFLPTVIVIPLAIYNFSKAVVEVASREATSVGSESIRGIPPRSVGLSTNTQPYGIENLVKPPSAATRSTGPGSGGMVPFPPFGSGPQFPAVPGNPASVWATARVGAAGKPFEDKSTNQALLIGLKVTVGGLGGPCLIHSVQPVYQGQGGFPNSGGFGSFGQFGSQDPPVYGAPIGKAHAIQAKSGYAVGGLIACGQDRLHGFKLLFFRVVEGGLDPHATYESEWLGGAGDGACTLIGGSGAPVVGIHGVLGTDLDAIGLFLTAKDKVPPPEEQARAVSPVKKLSPPGDEALSAAVRGVKEYYKNDYAKLRKPADRGPLAVKLLQQANETVADPAGRCALLTEARDLAIDAGDWNLAWRAAEAIGLTYERPLRELEIDVFQRAARSQVNAVHGRLLVEKALDYADELSLNEEFDQAQKVLSLAQSLASKMTLDASGKARLQASKDQLSERRNTYDEYRNASSLFQADPGNAQARRIVARYLCIQKGLWSAGLPILAKTGDDPLAKLAAEDLAEPTDVTKRLELADRWWEASEAVQGQSHRCLQRRAAYWYRRSVPQLSGVTKYKTEQRLAPIERQAQGVQRFTVQVSAKTAFTGTVLPADAFTGIEVQLGQSVEVRATGQWRIGAKPIPKGAKGLLVAAIGEAGKSPAWHRTFDDERMEFEATHSGKLFLGLNDPGVKVNTGTVAVIIEIW